MLVSIKLHYNQLLDVKAEAFSHHNKLPHVCDLTSSLVEVKWKLFWGLMIKFAQFLRSWSLLSFRNCDCCSTKTRRTDTLQLRVRHCCQPPVSCSIANFPIGMRASTFSANRWFENQVICDIASTEFFKLINDVKISLCFHPIDFVREKPWVTEWMC